MFLTGKPSIIIVDDDESILGVFTRIFERNGYDVTVASRGRDALQKLSLEQYDVALIDFSLPDMEGPTLFPAIKKSSPRTLRIILTGKTWLQDCVDGADVFVGKPVNPQKLLSIIDTELKNRDSET